MVDVIYLFVWPPTVDIEPSKTMCLV